MPKAKLTANRGASLSRQSIVAKLRRDQKAYGPVSHMGIGDLGATSYIERLIAWVNAQSLRAAKKPGGLGRR